MNKLNIASTGYPGTTESWKFLNTMIQEIAEAVAGQVTDDSTPVIIYGMNASGSNVSNGFFVWKGELFRFVGGQQQNYVVIIEEVENATYNTDLTNSGQLADFPTYYSRYARFGGANEGVARFLFSEMKRIKGLLKMSQSVDDASETNKGIIEIANQSEVNAGVDHSKAVTPKTLDNRVASESRSGIIQIATNQETLEGINDSKAITPAKLAGLGFARIIGKRTQTVQVAEIDTTTGQVHKIMSGSSILTGFSFPSNNYIVLASFNEPTNGALRTNSFSVYKKQTDRFGFHWQIEFDQDPVSDSYMDIDIIVVSLV